MKLSPPPKAPSATFLLRGNNCPQIPKSISTSPFQMQKQHFISLYSGQCSKTFVDIEAHSHDVRLMHASVADRCGAKN